MRTLYLTAGHQVLNDRGTGAFGVKGTTGKQFDEAVEARLLVNDVIKHLKKWYNIDVKTDNDGWSLENVIRWLEKQVKKDDIAIEFHFDAAAPSASGTGCFVPDINTNEEVTLASKLSFAIADAMGIKNRHVKTERDTAHKKIGILNRPKAATNILVETCFITNNMDVNAYRKNYYKVIQAISDTLANYINVGK